jgi:N-acetylglucosaminyl-diphospho-decaprenol L-rhamnosyltransferase
VPKPYVSVVVVSYNMQEHLERCLGALDANRYEVIVVDNASTDETVDLVRSRFPAVRLLPLRTNLGYGAGANRGIEVAQGSFVLLLNADVWPRDGEAVSRLVACAERERRAGVLGPKLVGTDGQPQVSIAGVPSRWWTGTPAISGNPPSAPTRMMLRVRPRGRSFLVGAALLLRREALEQVGGFDSDFFMFSEEIDLCLRLQDAGWDIVVCPDAVFVHVGGAATRSEQAGMYREQVRSHLRLLAKHRGHEAAERARRFLMIALRVRGLLSPARHRALYRETATWLRSADASDLLRRHRGTPPGRSEATAGRTTESGG